MAYFKTVWRRSWRDSWKLAFEVSIISTVIGWIGWGISLFFAKRLEGGREMTAHLEDGAITLAGMTAVFLMVWAVHFLWMTPRALWKEGEIKNNEILDKLNALKAECVEIWKPKLQITGTSRIQTPNEYDFDSVFRAAVVSLGFNPLGPCVARLESITKHGVEIFAHVETVLTFVDSGRHYAGSKQLDYNIPAYLQIVGLQGGRVRIAANNDERALGPYADDKIQEVGTYEIKITLSAHASVSVGASFSFTWTKDPNTSSLNLTGQWVIAPAIPKA